MEEALVLTRFASNVHVIHRRDELRASKILQDRGFANEKIDFIWFSEVKEFIGDDKTGLTAVRLVDNRSGEESDLEVPGAFIAIGHDPNSEVLRQWPIHLDRRRIRRRRPA